MKISKDEVRMRMSDNWHAHFRQGPMLAFLVPLFIEYGWRRRVVVEPNTDPPILTGKQALEYRKKILCHSNWIPNAKKFEPVMTIQITESTTAQMIRDAEIKGVKICKVYPRYVTTNSENGVVDYTKIYPALNQAEKSEMVVQFHSEHPSYDVIGRLKESAFRAILDEIRKSYPTLRISIEHVSSKDMIEWVKAQPAWVGAGVAIQHMLLTADDLIGYSKRSGGKICVDDAAFKPCVKDPEDREAIQNEVLAGNPKFWKADDDAFHPKKQKHSKRCPCGAANTVASHSLTLSFFEERGKLEMAEPFMSEFGANFYGFPLNDGEIHYQRSNWVVPDELVVPGLDDSVALFFAGETMRWKIVN